MNFKDKNKAFKEISLLLTSSILIDLEVDILEVMRNTRI